MTQEFQVLRCCQCATFQSHHVKKVLKWNCKLCGQKQSVIKVYGLGSGADCRRHVQKLNLMRGQAEEQGAPPADDRLGGEAGYSKSDTAMSQRGEPPDVINDVTATEASRWSHFLDTPLEDEDSSANEDESTTCRQEYSRQRRGTKRAKTQTTRKCRPWSVDQVGITTAVQGSDWDSQHPPTECPLPLTTNGENDAHDSRLGHQTNAHSPRLGHQTNAHSPRLGHQTPAHNPRLGHQTNALNHHPGHQTHALNHHPGHQTNALNHHPGHQTHALNRHPGHQTNALNHHPGHQTHALNHHPGHQTHDSSPRSPRCRVAASVTPQSAAATYQSNDVPDTTDALKSSTKAAGRYRMHKAMPSLSGGLLVKGAPASEGLDSVPGSHSTCVVTSSSKWAKFMEAAPGRSEDDDVSDGDTVPDSYASPESVEPDIGLRDGCLENMVPAPPPPPLGPAGSLESHGTRTHVVVSRVDCQSGRRTGAAPPGGRVKHLFSVDDQSLEDVLETF